MTPDVFKTVDDAIQKYRSLAEEVFTSESSDPGALFDHLVLEERIKDAIVAAPAPVPNTLGRDAKFKDPDFWDWRVTESKGGCRAFVATVHTRGSGAHPTLLRTYRTKSDNPFPGRIWEAARATSAAPTYFSTITIDEVIYGDGGLGYNNPTRLAINEAHDVWPERSIGCLVSLGTGEEDPNQLVEREKLSDEGGIAFRLFQRVAPSQLYRMKVAEYCAKSVTSCAKIHEDIQATLDRDQLRGKYFRINVPALGKIGLEEWKMISNIINLTTSYMGTRSMMETKIQVAKLLCQPSEEASPTTWDTAYQTPGPPTLNSGKKRAIDWEEDTTEARPTTGTDFQT
jgi:hypothetical protein